MSRNSCRIFRVFSVSPRNSARRASSSRYAISCRARVRLQYGLRRNYPFQAQQSRSYARRRSMRLRSRERSGLCATPTTNLRPRYTEQHRSLHAGFLGRPQRRGDQSRRDRRRSRYRDSERQPDTDTDKDQTPPSRPAGADRRTRHSTARQENAKRFAIARWRPSAPRRRVRGHTKSR
jgi:hypothetical protein